MQWMIIGSIMQMFFLDTTIIETCTQFNLRFFTFFQYIEHLTPEVLWQPHLLEHPNGAQALAALWFASTNPDETAGRLAPLVEAVPAREADGDLRIALGRGAFRVVDEAHWRRLLPRAELPPLPAPVAIEFRVRSLAATHGLLAKAGVLTHQLPGDLLAVAPQEACGATLLFSETSKGGN